MVRIAPFLLFFFLISAPLLAQDSGSEGEVIGVAVRNGVHYHEYKVARGETLYSISRQFNISIKKLKATNPQLKEGLKLDQVILIPKKAEEKPNDQQAEQQQQAKTHRVEKGETYYALSKRYQVPVAKLQKWNGKGLTAGDIIFLQAPDKALKQKRQKLLAKSSDKPQQPTGEAPQNEQKPQQKEEGVFASFTPDSQPQQTAEQQKQASSQKGPKNFSEAEGFGSKPKRPKDRLDSVPQGNIHEWETDPSKVDNDGFGGRPNNPNNVTNADKLYDRDPNHPADGTERVLIVPFDPYLYFSDADEEIAQRSDIPRHKVRSYFRRRLIAVMDDIQGYEAIHLLGGTAKDSTQDLDRIYKSLDYNYMEILNDDDERDGESASLQASVQKGEPQVSWKEKLKNPTQFSFRAEKKGKYHGKYFGVKVRDPEFFNYFNQKYGTKYYVFINQFEVETNFEHCLERAAGDFDRSFLVHYTIMDNEGNTLSGNKVRVFYQSSSNSITQIVNENMEKVADAVLADLPGK